MITLMMTMMITLMMMMVRSGGRSGASASRKPALLDRTKGGRQTEVAKVVIVGSIIILATSIILVVTSIITILTRQEKRLALEEGLRRPPSQPLPSLRPLSQPPSLRSMPPSSSSSSDFLRPTSLRPPTASLPWHSPVGQSSVGQKYLTWTPGQVTWKYVTE